MRLIGWAVSSVAFVCVLGVLIVLGALAYFSRDLPDYSQLADYEPPVTTRLYTGDGSLIAEYAVEHRPPKTSISTNIRAWTCSASCVPR